MEISAAVRPFATRSTDVPSRYAAQIASGKEKNKAISIPRNASSRVIGRLSLSSSLTEKPGLTSESPRSPRSAWPIQST